MKRITKQTKKPVRSSDVPATSAMLYEMEERVGARINSVKYELKSEMSEMKSDISIIKSDVLGIKSDISGIKSEMSEMKSEMSEMKSEMSEMKSEMFGMKSEMFGMKSELHRVALLVEEQNARNKFVMDGYAQVYELLSKKIGSI